MAHRPSSTVRHFVRAALASAAIACAVPATAFQIAGPITGQTAVPAFTLPPSNQLSPEALDILARMASAAAPADIANDVRKQRDFYNRFNDERLVEMRSRFQTHTQRSSMNNVAVDIVIPTAGIAAAMKNRVLINVHGGAFMWGAGSGALVEAIPIAATMGVKVVTVDYRLAPEHRYPSASQDVAAVYTALLKQYRPENIGIYGCSAGGVITAQTVAWLRQEKLPRPGAIGTLCGTAAPYSGDSPYLAGPLAGGPPLLAPSLPATLTSRYMDGVAASNSAAYPLASADEIKAMPPTLLLAGGRDFAASALTLAHRRLSAAHITSQLYLFDGLPHAFFMWPDMPESTEAYRIIATFFDRHLGRQAK